MNGLTEDFYEFFLRQLIESFPMAEISLSCIRQIITTQGITRERVLRKIIGLNMPFSIIHYGLIELREYGLLSEINYAYLLLQLHNWYRKESYVG